MRNKLVKAGVSDYIMRIVTLSILWLMCISLVLPVVWMLYTSFKIDLDYLLNSFSLPKKWTFENYPAVIKMLVVRIVVPGKGIVSYGMADMLAFSFLLTTGGSVMAVLWPAVTSYAVSKYNFKGRGIMYATALVVMIIPIIGALPSQMQIYKLLQIYDNLPLFILVSGGPFGFNFLLLYGAWKSIPWSYAEAASIDGAGHFKIMLKIMFPMMMPTFAALFVLAFIGGWNDYMTPIIWLPSSPNLAAGMFLFQSKSSDMGSSVPMLLAGFVIVALPSSILFLLTQKIITSQLTLGGLKG